MTTVTVDDLIAAAARLGVRARFNTMCWFERGDYEGPGASVQGEGFPFPPNHFTQDQLIDAIAVLQAQNPEDFDMNIFSTDLFKYLQGDMIGESRVKLTIANVTMEDIGGGGRGGTQSKPCLHFKEKDKTLILNKTNAVEIAQKLGPETDNWRGAVVTLVAPVIDAFGKQRRAVRIFEVQPAAVKAATPEPQPAE